MISILLFAAAWVACLAQSNEFASYSPAVGSGLGTPFLSSGEGIITGVKVWEVPNSHIAGIQLRHDNNWGVLLGLVSPNELSIDLFEGETITQVSGKFNPEDLICQLIFETSMGRALIAGQPIQVSFNFYPQHMEEELRMLSGTFDTIGITSLGAHWGIVTPGTNQTFKMNTTELHV
ncbi:prostatic spermine-binding protein-like [Gadus chalcogrammus]|uniref:prostatic spermine-binding protein-like n=1 Tax=Gadus chalcogrammus TaxID=1042646 RepID=UPI0024C37B57|nr:prostatic spermine-binding protein-like [Gadus chalcogrammus]